MTPPPVPPDQVPPPAFPGEPSRGEPRADEGSTGSRPVDGPPDYGAKPYSPPTTPQPEHTPPAPPASTPLPPPAPPSAPYPYPAQPPVPPQPVHVAPPPGSPSPYPPMPYSQPPPSPARGKGCLWVGLATVVAVVAILTAGAVLVAANRRSGDRLPPGQTPVPKTPTIPGGTKAADHGDFVAFYGEASDPLNDSVRQLAQGERLMEAIASGLNSAFALPHDVAVGMAECGQPNAFYSPDDNQLIICYEMFAFLIEIYGDDSDKISGVLVFVLFHELGHAVIDVYDLPAVGREEDAADQLAAVILVNAGEEESAGVLWAADFFDRTAGSELDFADEHSLNQQRVYNLLCWLYGSDPSKYSSIVTSGVLPESRAERCPDEYAQVLRAWNRLLDPYLME